MFRAIFLALGLCLLFVRPASAWAELGHQLVGELAQGLLTPEARKEVDALLAGEPAPTLAGIAYWADALRSTDAERFRATSRWHYVAIQATDCGYDFARDCADGACVVEAIRAQVRTLADRSQTQAARRDALKFLVHLVGDVHQPLHASNRPDKGGNAFQVSLRTPIAPEAYARANYQEGVMGTNLHSVWDYYVLAGARRTMKIYARGLRAVPPPSLDALKADPGAWAAESCRMIDDLKLYPKKHVMGHRYLDAMRPLAEKRVVTAAQRLAQLLNDLFVSRAAPVAD